jgi:glycosyltransferase involved in cell wall biosynthesis
MSALVSVVVAVHNGQETLGAALTSVLAQDYEPLEVIVVDDGSDDASGEVARSFAAVRVLRQQNSGPGAARNAGVANSRGAFLAFLDADDEALPHKLSLQVDHLERNAHVGCVLGRQEVEFVAMEQPAWMKRDAIFGDLVGICFTTAMIRRSAFEAVGGFDPDRTLQGSEDRDLMVRLRAAGIEIDVLPEVVIRRRFNGSNLTLQRPQSMLLTSLKSKLDRERSVRGGTAGTSS